MSHDAHAATQGFPKPHYKEYFVILGVLTALTAVELGLVPFRETLGNTVYAGALIALAISKAAFVGLFYMHLKHETNVLRWVVAVPLALPFVYALILIAEAGWRLLNAMPAHP